MREHNYFVYMIASRSRVLYIGMTNNLHRRVSEHKNGLVEGFAKEYKYHRLVYSNPSMMSRTRLIAKSS